MLSVCFQQVRLCYVGSRVLRCPGALFCLCLATQSLAAFCSTVMPCVAWLPFGYGGVSVRHLFVFCTIFALGDLVPCFVGTCMHATDTWRCGGTAKPS